MFTVNAQQRSLKLIQRQLRFLSTLRLLTAPANIVGERSGASALIKTRRRGNYPHVLESSVNPANVASQLRKLNIFSVFSKEAREREKERLQDELQRGYFEDIKDFRKNGGKIAVASPGLVPVAAAPSFPTLSVRTCDGAAFSFPDSILQPTSQTSAANLPRISLVFLAFRASAQPMVESWREPFVREFGQGDLDGGVGMYEISFVESWLLSLGPVQSTIVRFMTQPKADRGTTTTGGREREGEGEPAAGHSSEGEGESAPVPVPCLYSFGDTYYFRKALKIPNRLTAYVYLVDGGGRVRWQASGLATQEELQYLRAAAKRLLQESKRP